MKTKPTSDVVRQFQIAMALMSVIPMLGFVYLIGRMSGLTYLGRNQTLVMLVIIVISLIGMILARFLVSNVVGELRKASEMKSSFLRNVAHEASTPLATIRNNLEAMRDGLCGPLAASQEKPVAASVRQAQRLTRMVS